MESNFLASKSGNFKPAKSPKIELKDFFKVFRVDQSPSMAEKVSTNYYSNRIQKNTRKIFAASQCQVSPELVRLPKGSPIKSNELKFPKKLDKLLVPSSPSSPRSVNHKVSFFNKRKDSIKEVLKISQVSNIFSPSLIASRTRTGGPLSSSKKENQDSFIVIPNFTSNKSSYLLSVMDGHGVNGHLVSNYLKSVLPKYLETIVPLLESEKSNSKLMKFFQKAMKSIHLDIQTELSIQNEINVSLSGSTAITVIIHGNLCICSNIGDSRAIIGRLDNEWTFAGLSKDHKPNNTNEKKRIEKAGGRVEPCKDSFGEYAGPFRVWSKEGPYPGLAVSRSFGDLIASEVGVSCEPELCFWQIEPNDKFLVIASDGVWEVYQNIEVVRFLKKFYERKDVNKAADKLMEACVERWMKKGFTADDITIIILFFH